MMETCSSCFVCMERNYKKENEKGSGIMQEMFCFQCQQTAHNTGCEGKVGVCGKKAATANYQDELVGALIG